MRRESIVPRMLARLLTIYQPRENSVDFGAVEIHGDRVIGCDDSKCRTRCCRKCTGKRTSSRTTRFSNWLMGKRKEKSGLEQNRWIE